MTIIEMYNNNKEIKELDENIENYNAVVASGRTVGEDYFTKLEEMKEKRESMSIISEEKIDQKVDEYEKKVEEFEKNKGSSDFTTFSLSSIKKSVYMWSR